MSENRKKYLTILREGDKVDNSNSIELSVNIEIESPEVNSLLLKGFKNDQTLDMNDPFIESILYNCLDNGLYKKVLIYGKEVQITIYKENTWILISDLIPEEYKENTKELQSFLKPFQYKMTYIQSIEEINVDNQKNENNNDIDIFTQKNWKLIMDNKNMREQIESDVAMLNPFL